MHCLLPLPADRKRAPGHSLQAREQLGVSPREASSGGLPLQDLLGEMPCGDSSQAGKRPRSVKAVQSGRPKKNTRVLLAGERAMHETGSPVAPKTGKVQEGEGSAGNSAIWEQRG